MKEIKIITDDGMSMHDKGQFFENLISKLFEKQRYQITNNVRFTGMEIDIIASHKDRNETAWIECKARLKEGLSSNDIYSFEAKVRKKQAEYGYFICTEEFKKEVAGTIREFEEDADKRYKHLIFWGPQKCIDILQEDKEILLPEYNLFHPYNVSKEILAYTTFGTWYVLLLTNGISPTHVSALNAKDGSAPDSSVLSKLFEKIEEINGLEVFSMGKSLGESQNNGSTELVSDIKSSENWYDYLPASIHHFIGRQNIRNRIYNFLGDVKNQSTNKRVFYLEGKSGWGKSSILSELRGRAKNKQNKNWLYVSVIDTRSAISDAFVQAAFQKTLIDSQRFHGIDPSNLHFTSKYDIITSDSIQAIFHKLKVDNKVLVLVFDQFEDVFKKPGLFEAFHRLLLQTSDSGSNFVIGFSWKSELTIPADLPAYSLWQQAKDSAELFSLESFRKAEIKGVISQLEREIKTPLLSDLKRKLEESSQGYPWLTKKLCIHVLNQIKSKVKQETIIDKQLDCRSLFQTDLESISSHEAKALKLIAKKANQGDFFDKTEVGETIDEKEVNSLINKRLIILSGTKYNIYWDVFREYLITGEVRETGESYILRMPADACCETLLLFKTGEKRSIGSLTKAYPNTISQSSMGNMVRQLRHLGLVEKTGDKFALTKLANIKTRQDFEKWAYNKLATHAVYIALLAKKTETIERSDILMEFKKSFPGFQFSENTWNIYVQFFINWITFAKLELANRLSTVSITGVARGRTGTIESFMPQNSFQALWDNFLKIYTKGSDDIPVATLQKILYDLKFMRLIEYKKGKVEFTLIANNVYLKRKTSQSRKLFAQCMARSAYVEKAIAHIGDKAHDKKSLRKIIQAELSHINSNTYRKFASGRIASWAEAYVEHDLRGTGSTHDGLLPEASFQNGE
ncbi:MAG: restriction endonuclease [Candidatus Methylacidiphilales bacterium]|nr:restriction endonuclease [Candidatus Methylacidiphilales bacterium]